MCAYDSDADCCSDADAAHCPPDGWPNAAALDATHIHCGSAHFLPGAQCCSVGHAYCETLSDQHR